MRACTYAPSPGACKGRLRAYTLLTPTTELIELRPRRPRLEQLHRAPTTSTTDHVPSSSTELQPRPRRPRPEQLRRAPTTSTTRPRRNDDRREERRYDNRDHSHDDRSKSSRTGQLHHRRPDFYPKISTLLIFIFNTIFITTFLHNVLVMIILQITFVHVYHLKYNIHLYLMQILDQSC